MSQRLFLVRKLVIYNSTEGDANELPTLDGEIPGCGGIRSWYPVAAYRSRGAATDDAAARNRQLVDLFNPVWVLDGLNNFLEVPLADLGPLADLSAVGVHIPLPKTVHSEYGDYLTYVGQAEWYDAHVADWPAEVRAAVWRQIALNVGLFDVVEIELAD